MQRPPRWRNNHTSITIVYNHRSCLSRTNLWFGLWINSTTVDPTKCFWQWRAEVCGCPGPTTWCGCPPPQLPFKAKFRFNAHIRYRCQVDIRGHRSFATPSPLHPTCSSPSNIPSPVSTVHPSPLHYVIRLVSRQVSLLSRNKRRK